MGTGCKFEPGRWHQIGTQILYTSETVSLAKLEILANANRIPLDMCLAYIEIADHLTIDTLDPKSLPKQWNQTPYPNKLALLVKSWKKDNKSIALRVPSVHSPTEYNVLLNPHHTEYKDVKIIKIEEAGFDGRFFR